jgi:hypothetical protein
MLGHEVSDAAGTGGAARSVAALVGSMVVLAGLDLAGAVLARRWSDHGSAFVLVGGMAVFSLLFVVYGKSLDHGELSTVTIGWVVMLQVGVVILDAGSGIVVAPPKLLAIGLILLLQGYLIAG